MTDRAGGKKSRGSVRCAGSRSIHFISPLSPRASHCCRRLCSSVRLSARAIPTLENPSRNARSLTCAATTELALAVRWFSKIMRKQYRRDQSVIRSSLRMIVVNKKRARLSKTRPSVKVKSSLLELETNGQLHLAFAEQGAVRAGDLLERSVKGQTLQAATRRTASAGSKPIDCRIHSGDLRPIKEVECFGEKLNVGFFTNRESSRNPQIKVLN